jgi:phosphatidylglycerol:prolipoprotein diacylglycerol transferase
MMRELFRFHLFGHEIPLWGYGAMLVIGFYLAMQLGRSLARRSGIDPDVIVNVALIALIFGIVGARLSHVMENIEEYTRADRSAWENFKAMIDVPSGGLTFFGGLLLATLACITYGVMIKVPLRLGMDVIAPCVMIGLGFGRIGCYLNGCCYGAECSVPWAVHFPYHSNAYVEEYEEGRLDVPEALLARTPDGKHVRLKTVDEAKADPVASQLLKQKVPGVTESRAVHPAQLYSSFDAFLQAAVLIAYFTTRPAPGRVFALMLILQGLTRFLLEMVRAEPAVIGRMSFSMVLSIPFVIAGILMWYIVGRMEPSRPKFEYQTPAGTPATAF